MMNVRHAKRVVVIFTGVVIAEMMYSSLLPNDSFPPKERSLSTFLDQIERMSEAAPADERSLITSDQIEMHKSEAPADNIKDSLQPVGKNAEDHESCWRKCPQGRINRISYSGDTGGIGDRELIISELAELAGYLCAQLIFPKPARILHPLHNDWIRLDPYLQWSDFFNLTFADDNMPVIRSDVDRIPADYERIESHGGAWKEDFKKIQEHSWRQKAGDKGLAWDLLDARFYINDLTPHDLPHLPDDLSDIIGSQYNPEVMEPQLVKKEADKEALCRYTNWMTVSSQVQEGRTRLIERIREISPDASSIGIMHLRRGDAIQECDTSVARVKEMLSCSLKDTEKFGNITILLQSDERNTDYRQNITNLQNDFDHVNILDMDYMAKQVVQEAVADGNLHSMFDNNYHIFLVGSWVEGVEFTLTRRRMVCEDCTPLAEQFIDEEPNPRNYVWE
jgi:hypothetical protein